MQQFVLSSYKCSSLFFCFCSTPSFYTTCSFHFFLASFATSFLFLVLMIDEQFMLFWCFNAEFFLYFLYHVITISTMSYLLVNLSYSFLLQVNARFAVVLFYYVPSKVTIYVTIYVVFWPVFQNMSVWSRKISLIQLPYFLNAEV